MCGIAGILLSHGTPDRSALIRSAHLLAHRGPDDQGFYLEQSVGLVHTRLAIIDLTGGHQPIRDSANRYALVANGEIYNYRELAGELREAGQQLSTGSDCEIPLHLYATQGLDGFRRLHGMFAFALYDSARQQLILARDRLGIKPLYYSLLPDRLVFASELKALLPLLPGMPTVNMDGIDCFLETGFNSAPETLLRGIHRLEPGATLSIGPPMQPSISRFWSPADRASGPLDWTEANETLERDFATVLNEHIRADVPYGLFLSGGLDSGMLLAQLSAHNPEPIRTFSIGYQEQDDDQELTRARQIARAYRSEHTELRPSLSELFALLPLVVWAADDLMYDPACLPTAFMARRASRELKVVFTGEGGDEVFAGYGRYRRTAVQLALKRFADPAGTGYRTRSRWPWSLRRQRFSRALKSSRARRLDPLRSAWRSAPSGWSALQRAQLTDLRTELADGLLVKVDRMLMAFGLEGRVPYLDHRLVEFGLSLPDRFKVEGRTGKRILKHWALGALPRDDLHQKKRGFGVPLSAMLRAVPLGTLAEKLEANPLVQECFQPGATGALIDRQTAKGDVAAHLIQLLQLGLWYRLLLDEGPTNQPDAQCNPLDLL